MRRRWATLAKRPAGLKSVAASAKPGLVCAHEPSPPSAAGDPLPSRAPHRRRDAGRAGCADLSRGQCRETPRVLHRPSALRPARRARGGAGRPGRRLSRPLSVDRLRAGAAVADRRHRLGRRFPRAQAARRRRSLYAGGATGASPARATPVGALSLPQLLLPQARVRRGGVRAPARGLRRQPPALRRGASRAPVDAPRSARGRGAL